MDQIIEWDRELFLYLNGLNTGNWDQFWLLVTRIENWIPLYIIFFILFWKTLSRKRAIQATISTIILVVFTLGITALVKNSVTRLRPSNTPELEGYVRVLQENIDFSFFSGHSAVSFAITVFIILVLRSHIKWIWLLLIWPIIFAISRIFVGVHYPGDLLIGAVVGTIFGMSMWKIIRNKF